MELVHNSVQYSTSCFTVQLKSLQALSTRIRIFLKPNMTRTCNFYRNRPSFRLRVVPHFSSRDSRASETRARVKITPREKRRHAWGDFHARSRFARSTIPWGKMGDYSYSSLPSKRNHAVSTLTTTTASLEIAVPTGFSWIQRGDL